MSAYFARVTRGLERVSQIELSRVPGLRVERIGYRCLEFAYGQKPQRLLGLRSVDDVYVHLGRLGGITHTRDMLAKIGQFAEELSLDDALATCRDVRFVPDRPTFTITPSLRGRRNFSRYDVAEALRNGLSPHVGWSYRDLRESDAPADLDLRVVLDDDLYLFGMRLGEIPLHRRPYRQSSLPGALKAPVAYSLGLLAQPTNQSVVFDPMGGVGTLMIEAARGFHMRRAIAGDINPQAAAMASENAAHAHVSLDALVADAAHCPLPSGSITAIMSDLPWGRQVQIDSTAEALYHAVLSEVERLLAAEGCAVLLTEQTAAFMDALGRVPGLNLILARQISLFGSHPTIFILGKTVDPYLNRVMQDRAWRAFVQDALKEAQAHPDAQVRAMMTQIAGRVESTWPVSTDQA